MLKGAQKVEILFNRYVKKNLTKLQESSENIILLLLWYYEEIMKQLPFKIQTIRLTIIKRVESINFESIREIFKSFKTKKIHMINIVS